IASIEDAFARGELDYGRKLYLIENCLYGVDIQPIAVQIAKMRFFISLTVDQKPDPSQPNLGIRPLPNLETKFVAANTLIGIKKPESQGRLFDDPKVIDLTQELGDIRHQMFTARTPLTKQRLRDRDDALRAALAAQVKTAFVRANEEEQQRIRSELEQTKSKLEEEKAKPPEWHIERFKNLFGEIEETRIDLSKKRKQHLQWRIRELETQLRRTRQVANEIDTVVYQLAHWNPYDQNASADFFDPEWMFGITTGFDVVIGNPPYIRVDELRTEDKDAYRKIYSCTTGKYDLYYLFVERGLKSLPAGGTLCFITPNKFCAAASAATLRGLIFTHTQEGEIVSTSKLGVFEEAANYPVIGIYHLGSTKGELLVREAVSIDAIRDSSPKAYCLPIKVFETLPEGIIPINVSQTEIDFVIRQLRRGYRLGSVCSISEGLRLPASYEREQHSDFMIVKQFQFERWTRIRQGAYISERDLKRVVSPRSDRFAKIASPKVVIAEDALQITATVDEDTCVPQGGVYFGVVTDSRVKLRFVLGLLNSRLASRIYEILFGGMHMGSGYLRYRTNFLEKLPIPDVPPEKQQPIIALVDKILEAKRADPNADVSALEREIDQHVYRLYGLTPEEIKIVEDGTK
ncbi:MAG: Eco57I restriction-modification methylase domain-containing protein, partial [Anaerolineales bacterium]|nr:Eco57I restriction-modification methylase domain-containing protein [Anaerolineales bacterium]